MKKRAWPCTPRSPRELIRYGIFLPRKHKYRNNEIVTSFKEWKKLKLELKDWGTFDQIGKGYAFNQDGKFYSILETKVGSYRGNHIHPHNQYTLLLSGKARYILILNGVYEEKPLTPGEVAKVDQGIPHILIVDEDITAFEWWDGDFIAELCKDEFKDYTKGRVGPEHYTQ